MQAGGWPLPGVRRPESENIGEGYKTSCEGGQEGCRIRLTSSDYRTDYNSTETPHTGSVTTLLNVQVTTAIDSQ
jgi:hypothetical protein